MSTTKAKLIKIEPIKIGNNPYAKALCEAYGDEYDAEKVIGYQMELEVSGIIDDDGKNTIKMIFENRCYDGSKNEFKQSVQKAIDKNSIRYSCCNKIIIPDGVTEIKESAFSRYKDLTSITIPSSVKYIGKNAFSECERLVDITISDGVTSIGDQAFEGCTDLINIIIPSSVKSIGKRSFANCSHLKAVTLNNGLEKIGEEAFLDCDSLISITIPDSVTSIGDQALEGCTTLVKATIPLSIDMQFPKSVTVRHTDDKDDYDIYDKVVNGWDVDQLLEDGANRWTKYGKDRIYIDVDLCSQFRGLKVTRYKTGNISGSWINGKEISHRGAFELIESYRNTFINLEDGSIHCGDDWIIDYLKENYYVGDTTQPT